MPTTCAALSPRSLLAGAGALAGASAARADDAAGVASSRMSYSRFLEYLEMGRVKKVGGRCAALQAASCVARARGCRCWAGVCGARACRCGPQR